jgi:hypothetical protein
MNLLCLNDGDFRQLEQRCFGVAMPVKSQFLLL